MMHLKFSTPCAFSEDTLCASFGFAGAMEPAVKASVGFPHDLSGVLLTGSFEEILAKIPAGNYQAGLVFLGNCGKEDGFVQKLSEKAGCALTGGSAAIDPATGEKDSSSVVDRQRFI